MSVFVGVDVGGTKVLAAVVSPTGEVVRSVLARTPGRLVDAGVVEDVMTDAVLSVADGETIEAVGVAAAGLRRRARRAGGVRPPPALARR